MIYSNKKDSFKIIDFAITHNQLLIRSMKSRIRDYNIDIIFYSVENLLIPTSFNGIEISIDKNNLLEKYNYKADSGYKTFQLMDVTGKLFYINALSFCIFHNTIDSVKTSIGRYDFGSMGEEIVRF